MTNYRVFRDDNKNPVLETNDLKRAHQAMDSMFEVGMGASYDRPREVKILNSYDQIIELRRADKVMRLIPEVKAEVHHHSVANTPLIRRAEKKDTRPHFT